VSHGATFFRLQNYYFFLIYARKNANCRACWRKNAPEMQNIAAKLRFFANMQIKAHIFSKIFGQLKKK